MKRIYLLSTILLLSLVACAQDTTKKTEPDTVRVGNFMIIKKPRNTADTTITEEHYQIDIYKSNRKYSYDYHHDTGYIPHKHIVSTNWLILDLGFANYNDKTQYGTPKANAFLNPNGGKEFSKNDLKLITGKSTNINIWAFIQKLNLSKQVVNLKYGLGYSMYNFRFKHDITYVDDPVSIVQDSVHFSKNKLFVAYATAPLMLNITPSPNKYHSFNISAGASAGYRIGTHTKQKSDERGKEKDHDSFNLKDWMFAYVAEIGLGRVRLYGSYSINPLHEDVLKQHPYALGLRLSNW